MGAQLARVSPPIGLLLDAPRRPELEIEPKDRAHPLYGMWRVIFGGFRDLLEPRLTSPARAAASVGVAVSVP